MRHGSRDRPFTVTVRPTARPSQEILSRLRSSNSSLIGVGPIKLLLVVPDTIPAAHARLFEVDAGPPCDGVREATRLNLIHDLGACARRLATLNEVGVFAGPTATITDVPSGANECVLIVLVGVRRRLLRLGLAAKTEIVRIAPPAMEGEAVRRPGWAVFDSVLAEWWMHLARSLLSDSTLAIGEIGGRIGYDSEAAVSRAFRRAVVIHSAVWRQANRGSGDPEVEAVAARRL